MGARIPVTDRGRSGGWIEQTSLKPANHSSKAISVQGLFSPEISLCTDRSDEHVGVGKGVMGVQVNESMLTHLASLYIVTT